MQRFGSILRSLLAAGALVSIGYGCYLIFPPAAFIVAGGLVWWDVR